MPEPVSSPSTVALAVVDSAAASVTTVVVDAPTGTSWGDVRQKHPATRGLGDAAWVGDTRLTDEQLLGGAPLLHGAVISDRPAPSTPPALLRLVALDGPDAGRELLLTSTVTVVGRDGTCGLQIADDALSRQHLRVELTQGRVVLVDLHSTNGTSVDGEPLTPGQPIPVRTGSRVRLGDTTLQVRASHIGRGTPIQSGRRRIHRSHRRPPSLATVELERPAPPAETERPSMPWMVILLPLPLAGVLALVMDSALMLAFGLMSPVMAVGQYLHERRTGRRRSVEAQRQYERRLREHDARLDALRTAELTERRRLAPDLATMREQAADRALWPRLPRDTDHLWWRVGIGDVETQIAVRGQDGTTHESLAEAPVVVPLAEHAVAGVATPRRRRRAVDALVAQLTVLHSPLFLDVVVLTDDARLDAWRSTTWLPHLRDDVLAPPRVFRLPGDLAAAATILQPWSRAPEDRLLSADRPTPRVVVLLDGGPDLARVPVVADLLRYGHDHGVVVVAVAERAADLPAECEVVVDLSGERGRLIGSGPTQTLIPDVPTAGWWEQVAGCVVPCVDTTPGGGDAEIPHSARLLDILPATDADGLADLWRRQPRSTRLSFGVDGDGAVPLDLALDGPHVLVGGTTGSGKSEMLQSLITALAAANRPDELVFVLVDYKGGSAFKDCARLPHTVGLVTDLDPFLTQRALTSLEAEIRRRERELARVGATDLLDYQRIDPADAPALPRLVLVIDEFRVLAEELPDFIEGLVRLAAVGRSLGIHLVLATQRPSGIVSADVRANMNLRIALRVRESGDSDDIIESPIAAKIDSSTPGRAILRVGGGAPVTLQTARVGGPAAARSSALRVLDVDEDGHVRLPLDGSEPDVRSDLEELVDVLNDASEQLGVTAVDSPWLAPLPDRCVLDELPAERTRLGEHSDEPAAPLGVLDRPAEQSQSTLAWSPDAGSLGISGGPRSGRSSTLRTLVTSLARCWTPDDLHVYVLDLQGSLDSLRALPHTGAVLARDDVGTGVRLLDWLREQVLSRQRLLASASLADLSEQRQGPDPLPRLLLVLDGWETFSEAYEPVRAGAVVDQVLELLREGSAAGVDVVMTGGRGLLSSRVAGLLRHRLVLRTADEMDLVMAGLNVADVPSHMPPGRALLMPDGDEVQVALLAETPTGAAQAAVVADLAASLPPPQRHPPRRFTELPDRVALADLLDPSRGSASGDPVIGRGEDDTLVTWQPDPAWGRTLLVAGPPGSGRTTTALALAQQLTDDTPLLWVAGGAPPPWLPPHARLLAAGTEEVWEALQSAPTATLVVDDLDMLADPGVGDALLAHLEHVRQGRGAVLATSSTDALTSSYGGPGAELRRRRHGVLLQPGRHDGDLLGTTVPPCLRPVPGRGALVHGRSVQPLQAAAANQPAEL